MADTTPQVTRDQIRTVWGKLQQHIADASEEVGIDPLGLEIADMTGIDYYQRWLGEPLAPPPPWALVFAMEWLEVVPGRAVAALTPGPWMFNQVGTVHGGVAATLLDTALGAAVHSKLPARTGFATTDLHTRYLRPIMADTGRVIATATAVHVGRRQATAEGKIEVEATGKLIATATAAWTIFEIPS